MDRMMGRLGWFTAVLLVPGIVIASKADEAAIRKQLRVKSQAFAKGNAKQLATTDMPDFHAITFDGKLIPTQQINDHIAWRFKNQTKSKREERPHSFKFSKGKAEVKLTIFDDFVSKDEKGLLTRSLRREHGISTWVKTASGWKQSKLQFTKVEWVDAQGKWQSRP